MEEMSAASFIATDRRIPDIHTYSHLQHHTRRRSIIVPFRHPLLKLQGWFHPAFFSFVKHAAFMSL